MVPYIVLAAVVVLFFIVCRIAVYGSSGVFAFFEKSSRRRKNPSLARKRENPKQPSAETPSAFEDDATQAVPVHAVRKQAAQREEETKVISRKELAAAPSRNGGVPFPFEKEEEPVVADGLSLSELEEHFTRRFLNRYGATSSAAAEDARTVTTRLAKSLRMNGRDARDTLTHIMVQEALQNAQRAYVMMPKPFMLNMLTEAFLDVARGKRGERKTAVAYDALRVLPRLEESGMNALSLLFLFHYSRNTENVDADAWREYTNRYIRPFIDDLPDEYDGYRQLEYLHCIASAGKEMPFGQVLRDAYPLVFAFRGCKKGEWEETFSDFPKLPMTESLYEGYEKPAAADDALLSELLASKGVEAGDLRRRIIALVQSRPVIYDRKETAHVLRRISPDLARMQDIWDAGLLRRSSLTLMGMYIARLCVKEIVGEEFDMSDWI